MLVRKTGVFEESPNKSVIVQGN